MEEGDVRSVSLVITTTSTNTSSRDPGNISVVFAGRTCTSPICYQYPWANTGNMRRYLR